MSEKEEKLAPAINPELFISSQVAQGLSVIGDRWAFLILRNIYLGVNRFDGLRKRIECSRGTLSSRLKSLLAKQILFKKAYQQSPPRFEYCLSEKGLDLYPMVLMMWKWEQTWARREDLPQTLTHKVCGKQMLPVYKCKACGEELSAQQTRYSVREKFDRVEQVPARAQRRTKSALEKKGSIASHNMHVLDCVGDRWTSLVLAASFFGVRRFDDMVNAIQVGTSVLTDRLSLLVQTGIMDRVEYQQKPPRYEYRLSAKGRDLYGHTMAIHEWAERWLINKDKGLLKIQHEPCGKPFHGEVVCNQCNGVLYPHEVSYGADKT